MRKEIEEFMNDISRDDDPAEFLVGPPMTCKEMVQLTILMHKKVAPAGCDCDICQGKCDHYL